MKKYAIYLWPGSGYGLIPFEVVADGEEHAIDVLTSYLIKNNMKSHFVEVDEIDDEEAELSGYMYVDATMEGADRPVYLLVENMKIYTV